MEIPWNTDWSGNSPEHRCGDSPEQWVWGLSIILTGMEIPRNTDWCGDSPEY